MSKQLLIDLPFYRAFQEKYNLLKKDPTITLSWTSMREFHLDMYEVYAELRSKYSKVSHTVDGAIANKTTLTFTPRENHSALVNNIIGVDYTKGVPDGIYHSLQLAVKFKQPHANIRRKLKALKESGNFGDTIKATVISGSTRKTKSEVEVLTKEQNDTLDMALTISSSILKPTTVYLITYGSLVKVGISSNVDSRFKKLSSSSPVPLDLRYTKSVTNARKVEKDLHLKYASHNSHGEWFNLTDTQVQDVIEYLDNMK